METKESSTIEKTAKKTEQTPESVEVNACIDDKEFHEPEKVNPVWEYFKKYRGTITITDPNLM